MQKHRSNTPRKVTQTFFRWALRIMVFDHGPHLMGVRVKITVLELT